VVTGFTNVGGGNKSGTATVTLVDANGAPIGGYFVEGDFGGSITEQAVSAEPTSPASGEVNLQTAGQEKGGVSVTFCVSGIVFDGIYSRPGALNEADLCPLP
jgi:hypothetical protein